MEIITKFISMALLLCFFMSSMNVIDCCDNDKTKTIITQQLTGAKIKNQPQWRVTLKAPCDCCQTNVKIGCKGFRTAEPLDSNVITKTGDICSPNGSICPGSSTIFTYAWNQPYNFTALSFQVACS